MVEMIQANWLVFAVALVFGLLLAWWLFARGSKPRERSYRPDVLDEGAAPAQRNQALIDSAPAARFDVPIHVAPKATAGTLEGVGEVFAVAEQNELDTAEPPIVPDGQVDKNVSTATPAPVASAPVVPAQEEPALEKEQQAADDLRKIKGIGPKLAALLQSLNVTHYAQIAAWTDSDLDDLDGKLGAFAGRPRRDNWIEQARLLSSGDTGAYEAKFGKL